MRPLAHHAGEDLLVNLLLVGAGWLSVAAAVGRAQVAAARARRARRQRSRRRAELPARAPSKDVPVGAADHRERHPGG